MVARAARRVAVERASDKGERAAGARERSANSHSRHMTAPAGASTGYRFVFTRTRGHVLEREKSELACCMQLAEVNIFGKDASSVLAPGTIATNPGGGIVSQRQSASQAIDQDIRTKWLDANFKASGRSILEIRLPSAQAVASYQLTTANDNTFRDPVAWSVEMQLANGSWAILDERAFEPPAERLEPYSPTAFVLARPTILPGCACKTSHIFGCPPRMPPI